MGLDAAVVLAMSQNGQGRSHRAVALDQDDFRLIRRRDAILGLKRGPEFRHFIQRYWVLREPHALELCVKSLPASASLMACWSSTCVVVKNAHRLAQQDVRCGVVVIFVRRR